MPIIDQIKARVTAINADTEMKITAKSMALLLVVCFVVRLSDWTRRVIWTYVYRYNGKNKTPNRQRWKFVFKRGALF